MKAVHKYPFENVDRFDVEMPAGASVLHVDIQRGQPCMWALVDTDARRETRTFYVRGTGHPVPDGVVHVGSFQQPPFVWHLFTLEPTP